MSREAWKRSLGILAVIAGIASAVACGGSSYTSNPTAPNPAPSGGGGSGSADVTITINGMLGAQSFTPSPATVKVGQTVAWRNADSIPHNPTGPGFTTATIGPGQTSQPVTFSAAGNVDYHCAIHPTMVGTLTVTQ
jgi:plastocyanin